MSCHHVILYYNIDGCTIVIVFIVILCVCVCVCVYVCVCRLVLQIRQW